ncbi:alpha/beta hydrolase [Paraburkholderia caballeronis]|uniref:Alpha/beta hydrolase family protein n=1 Tax=Paraburkholderia caballeronis TaxID=416943 RepID=A0A1H7JX02_9BURK|nr:alpha/beta hydrolase [Paraburkholderia caballeronis]PXW27242.1 alpha/beta hydrolase family protein [Paraburkholderia caballeronis]PXX02716.1 alpha/beta hydrolase family protein [Paraburkholderia caballeronis]RAK03441.1 alpha/beta hydrolase family protein [Paraburkholderia caballeronis]TDV36241.1 alpha/beta hydrolase family protein [Paraburkholderia caballeronis]SEC40507.1 Alpha/beta hydrolase family protein [Paraburkholderia caballeronis]
MLRPQQLASYALSSVLLCAASLAVDASAAQNAPLPVADHGYFYVGGQYQKDANGQQRMFGQMFVQYEIPQTVRHPYPIVMIHGTDQTGTNYLGTPDGRRGWADYFVAQGYTVYVVDQAGRGRSGQYPSAYGSYARGSALVDQQFYTAPERYNLWPQAHLHTQWPGGPGVVGNPTFDQFMASQVESMSNVPETEAINAAASAALLDRIGPAILLTHSQSGTIGWKIADERPKLVKAIVAVEPNGPTFYDPVFTGGNDWYHYNTAKAERPWGLTRVPLTYDPPVTDPAQLARVEQKKAEGPGLVRCWLQAEPAHQLPNLRNIPIAIVTSEASFRATYDQCTSDYLTQAGVPNTHIRLADVGVHGNAHMMMLEQNSDQIAGVIAGWLGKNSGGSNE